MRITIHSSSIYTYAEPASFSPHVVRLFPRGDRFVHVREARFRTNESADVQFRRDLFDNEVAVCFFPEKCEELSFLVELDIDLTEKNPFHFLLESHALEVPFEYKPQEVRVLAPYLERRELKLPSGLAPTGSKRPTVEAITSLNHWIFENFEYERREEGDPMTPEETLAAGRAACRDFAVLLVEVLRIHGIAARLASGYLWEAPDTAEDDLRAQTALHAWVEAYLPGAGWVGLDPTNGVLCDHHRITAAVGLLPSEIAPTWGFYYGDRIIESRMKSSLEIFER